MIAHPRVAEKPPVIPTDDPRDRKCEMLEGLVPTDPNVPYDMKLVIREVRSAPGIDHSWNSWQPAS